MIHLVKNCLELLLGEIRFHLFKAEPAQADAAAGTLARDVTRLIPGRRVRLSISALIATIAELPDMDNAATSGDKVNGYSTPAASGKAITL